MSDFRPLQKKAEAEFNRFASKYKKHMTCTMGCSKCCIDDLSVFAWEASIISDWFEELSPQQKQQWKELQQLAPRPEGENQQDACAFLHRGQCTIYEVRPTLCRTQGMALQYLEEGKGEKVIKRDWCPLNFDDSPIGPEPVDDLNLDALNQMLAQAQMIYEQENPDALGPVRVDLRELRDYLIGL